MSAKPGRQPRDAGPRRILFAVLAICMASSCMEKPKPTLQPVPHWVKETEGMYAHWDCPDGWTTKYHIHVFVADTVTCEPKQNDLRHWEQLEKEFRPQ
jgi:hypothetical protein